MSKVCSECGEQREVSLFSGAQLKKKGKRVCTPCITGQPPPPPATDQTEPDTQVGAAPSSDAGADAASVSPAVDPTTRLASLAAGSFPPNAHFPSSAPVAFERDIAYYNYTSELQMPLMTRLIERDLSEPYSVFTYRYFLNFWPNLTFMAMAGPECIGCIVCRLVLDKQGLSRGYIAMLAVSTLYRNRSIGSRLVRLVIDAMRAAGADLVVLEAEVTNKGALALYEKLNFVRETRLVKYYLSGSDAFRLKLWLRPLQPAAPGQPLPSYTDHDDD